MLRILFILFFVLTSKWVLSECGQDHGKPSPEPQAPSTTPAPSPTPPSGPQPGTVEEQLGTKLDPSRKGEKEPESILDDLKKPDFPKTEADKKVEEARKRYERTNRTVERQNENIEKRGKAYKEAHKEAGRAWNTWIKSRDQNPSSATTRRLEGQYRALQGRENEVRKSLEAAIDKKTDALKDQEKARGELEKAEWELEQTKVLQKGLEQTFTPPPPPKPEVKP